MSRSETFAMLLRGLGVWEFVNGLESLPQWFAFAIETFQYSGSKATFLGAFLSFSAMRLVAGPVLFFGAPWFASKVYRDSEPTPGQGSCS
jgi:hypothetical protein